MPLSVLTIIAIISLARFGYFLFLHSSATLNGTFASDFPNYYFPALRLLQGRGGYSGVAAEVTSFGGINYAVYPADPPVAHLLLAPLGLLDYWSAALLLFTVSIALGALLPYMAARELAFSRRTSLLASCIFLGSTPFLQLLKFNHIEMILIGALFLGWRSLRGGKSQMASFFLGVAGAIKLFPLAWCWSVSLCYRRVAPLAWFILLSVLGLISIGASEMHYYLTEIVPSSSQWYGALGNFSLVSFFTAAGYPFIGWVLVALVGTLFLIPRLWRVEPDLVISRAVTLSLLVSPISWVYYFVLLCIPLLVLVKQIKVWTSNARILYLSLGVLLWASPEFINLGVPLLTLTASWLPMFGLAILALLLFQLGTQNSSSDKEVNSQPNRVSN